MVSACSRIGDELLALEQCSQLVLQLGQLNGDDVPNNRRVHAEILVDKQVPEVADPLPVDISVLPSDFVRYMPACFANDLEVADHGILQELIALPIVERLPLSVAQDLAHRFGHVLQQEAVVTPGHAGDPVEWPGSSAA